MLAGLLELESPNHVIELEQRIIVEKIEAPIVVEEFEACMFATYEPLKEEVATHSQEYVYVETPMIMETYNK